jgi:hypothetical protein
MKARKDGTLFIGDLRRQLFISVDHEWNGVVRDITASCETSGERVDSIEVCSKIAKFYRGRASIALIQLAMQ